MMPLHKIYFARIFLFLSFVSLVIPATISQAQGAFILNVDDIQAKKWMMLDAPKRASFVMGFLAGLHNVYNSMDLLVTLKEPLSAQDLSSEVYSSLLNQPELRTGPIDKIIFNALDHVLFITNKWGRRIDPGLRNISLMKP